MATVRSDLPDTEVLQTWTNLDDVIGHFKNGGDDIKAIIVDMGGDPTDGIEVVAIADPEAILECVTD